ncbi:glycosyltransferase family 2 protein, partial [Escherichia coli]|nr:glycosyltransferase family 2 protein [Escherichia coli]
DMGDAFHKKGWRSNSGQYAYDFGQINHYAIKSREEFLLKRLRGTANSKNKDRIDTDYWGRYDLNACADSTIRTDGIRPGIDALLQDTALRVLHEATLDISRKVIDYQLQDDTWRRFVETGSFGDEVARATETA